MEICGQNSVSVLPGAKGNNTQLEDDFFYGIFDEPVWYNAVYEIRRAINYNDKGIFNYIPLTEGTISHKQADSILIAYVDAINNDAFLPEYSPEIVNDKLIQIVANNSAVNIELVKRVLIQLYWYTKSGVIKTTGILNPRKSKTQKSDYKDTHIIGKAIDGIGNTLTGVGGIIKNLPTILIVGGIAVGGYFLFKATDLIKNEGKN